MKIIQKFTPPIEDTCCQQKRVYLASIYFGLVTDWWPAIFWELCMMGASQVFSELGGIFLFTQLVSVRIPWSISASYGRRTTGCLFPDSTDWIISQALIFRDSTSSVSQFSELPLRLRIIFQISIFGGRCIGRLEIGSLNIAQLALNFHGFCCLNLLSTRTRKACNQAAFWPRCRLIFQLSCFRLLSPLSARSTPILLFAKTLQHGTMVSPPWKAKKDICFNTDQVLYPGSQTLEGTEPACQLTDQEGWDRHIGKLN